MTSIKVGEKLTGKRTYYFAYRLQCCGAIKDGKVQATAALMGTAITDALEQVRRMINNGIKVGRNDWITCELTDLETQKSGYFETRIGEHWAGQKA